MSFIVLERIPANILSVVVCDRTTEGRNADPITKSVEHAVTQSSNIHRHLIILERRGRNATANIVIPMDSAPQDLGSTYL